MHADSDVLGPWTAAMESSTFGDLLSGTVNIISTRVPSTYGGTGALEVRRCYKQM